MNEAIKWFKGTVTGKTLYSKGNEGYKDFEVALRIAKKEVFDDIDNNPFNFYDKKRNFVMDRKSYNKIKEKHLGKKQLIRGKRKSKNV